MSTTSHDPVDPGIKLGRMANQIANFFHSYPEEEGIAGVQEHIVSFWSPVMRRDLARRIETDPVGLDLLVLRAAERMARGKAAPAESPTRRENAGPAEAGQLGASDAG